MPEFSKFVYKKKLFLGGTIRINSFLKKITWFFQQIVVLHVPILYYFF